MKKRVLVISTSLRGGSNSEQLAEAFAAGAREAGHEVEFVSLKQKKLQFCIGCLSCLETGHCVLKDDAAELVEKMRRAEVIAFATPIYYYEMSGQMKVLLDRSNPLFESEYAFRDIYLLTVAAENEAETPEGAEHGLKGWIACFEKARLAGSLFSGGNDGPNTIKGKESLAAAHALGKKV